MQAGFQADESSDAAGDETRRLKHELANARQRAAALQQMLMRAAAEIEALASGECAAAYRAEALKAADRYRRAASL